MGFARTLPDGGAVDVPAAAESDGFLPFFLRGACPLAEEEGVAAALCSVPSPAAPGSSLALRLEGPWVRRAGVAASSSAVGTSAIVPSAVPLGSLRRADRNRFPTATVGSSDDEWGLEPVEGPASSSSPSPDTSSTSAMVLRLAPEVPAVVDRVTVGFVGVGTCFSVVVRALRRARVVTAFCLASGEGIASLSLPVSLVGLLSWVELLAASSA